MPHLSFSQLTTLWGCPEKHRRTYVLGEREAPSPAIIMGQAAHSGIEGALRASQGRMPFGKAGVVAEVERRWHELAKSVVDWSDGPKKLEPETGLAYAKAMAQALYEHAVPEVRRGSTHCEWRFDEDIAGEPGWTFTGSIDHMRTVSKQIVVDDWKTTSSRWSQSRADSSLQVDAYYWAVRRVFGKLPSKFVFHVVTRPKLVKGPSGTLELGECSYDSYETSREPGAIDLFEKRIGLGVQYIKRMHDAEAMSDPRTDWEYHKYCSFKKHCTPWELGTLGNVIL